MGGPLECTARKPTAGAFSRHRPAMQDSAVAMQRGNGANAPVKGERPRVTVWCWARRGGAANHTFELARALAGRDDIELSLCVSRRCDRLADLVALKTPLLANDTYGGLVGIAASAWRMPRAAIQFARFLRNEKSDVVLCSFTHLWNPFVLPIIRACGCRFILTVHDGLTHPGDPMAPPQWWLDHEVRAAFAIVTLTEHVKSQLVNRLRIPQERITVIPPGPYVAAGGPGRAPEVSRQPRRLLFFGRIWPYKGVDILLASYRQLKQRFPDLSLRIVGSGDFAPYQADARALADVEVDLRYVPEGEIPHILEDADVLVLPYREATQSGLVSIAQAVGLPVVATPVGGLKEQIVHGETGLLATAATPQALAEAIMPLLSDPDLHVRLSRSIRNAGANSWDEAAARTAELVSRVARTG